ncbi:cation:proton antiporter regulatory subunit [Halorubrum sp. AD140]|uniref:cation:proton antiporter regulatory subunit n=1 Tax=Halorubrum sp. AD140 TaxID=3050073 RepID=UPI00350E3807
MFRDARIRWIATPVDSPLAGKTIREEEVRTQTNASIIGIQRETNTISNPSPDTRIQANDVLVVVGSDDDIQVRNPLVPGTLVPLFWRFDHSLSLLPQEFRRSSHQLCCIRAEYSARCYYQLLRISTEQKIHYLKPNSNDSRILKREKNGTNSSTKLDGESDAMLFRRYPPSSVRDSLRSHL